MQVRHPLGSQDVAGRAARQGVHGLQVCCRRDVARSLTAAEQGDTVKWLLGVVVGHAVKHAAACTPLTAANAIKFRPTNMGGAPCWPSALTLPAPR